MSNRQQPSDAPLEKRGCLPAFTPEQMQLKQQQRQQPPRMDSRDNSNSNSKAEEDGEGEEEQLLVSASELQMLQETFQLFDKDGDGCITTDELGTVLACIGRSHTELQLKEMLKKIDKDGNGTIELDEFIQLMKSEKRHKRSAETRSADTSQQQRQSEEDSEDELLAAFHVFDKDRNGYISAPELKEVLAGLGYEYADAEVEEMLKEVDSNGDGQIDFPEFVSMLTSAPSRVASRLSVVGGSEVSGLYSDAGE